MWELIGDVERKDGRVALSGHKQSGTVLVVEGNEDGWSHIQTDSIEWSLDVGLFVD